MGGDEVILGEDGLFETVILDHPQFLEIHQEGSEDSDEQLQLLSVHLRDAQHLTTGKALLGADQQTDHFAELFWLGEERTLATPELQQVVEQLIHSTHFAESGQIDTFHTALQLPD